MKLPNLLAFAGALILGATGVAAADPTPAAPAATPTAAPATAGAEAELKAIAQKLQDKFSTGAKTAADYDPEVKLLDEFVAKHKADGTEVPAEGLFLKAMLRLRVLEDLEGSAAVLRQIIETYPKSGIAQRQAAPALEQVTTLIQSAKVSAALKPGLEFPDFQERDLSGASLSLAKYKGKVVLLDFWATWCGPCINELPNVLDAYKKYHAKGFEIVGISLDQDQGTLEGFVDAKGMSWQQYFDGAGWQNKLVKRYGVTSIPATYLIGPDGKIVAKDLRGPALDEQLAKLLGP